MALAVLTGASLAGPLAPETGVVEGTVTLPESAPRRWASRYPGAGMGSARLHAVRPVVYLTGDLPPGPVAGGDDAARGDVEIRQSQGRFVPGTLAVLTGTVVRFPNDDTFYHNVFSYSGPRFDLGRYPAGQSRQITLDRPGIVQIFCEIHEFMRAVVLVTDHPYHAVVGEDGSFRIQGVPPGEYTLHVYHPDWDAVEAPVSVDDNATVRVSLRMGG